MTTNWAIAGTSLVFLAASACAVPQPPGAGLDAEAVRAFLIEGLETNKQMDIEFARAIPDSALRWAPTNDVRDFAEQILHAADNYWVVSGYGEPAPSIDTTVLNDKEAIVAEVTRAYDWVIEQARQLPASRFTETGQFFGQPVVRWRSFMQVIEHATWTRGQLVPYFHSHGVAVPAVTFY